MHTFSHIHTHIHTYNTHAHLYLNMMRVFDEALDEHAVVTERAQRLSLTQLEAFAHLNKHHRMNICVYVLIYVSISLYYYT